MGTAAKADAKDLDADDQSVCSTAAPPSQSARLSIASSSASTTAASVPAQQPQFRGISETPPVASHENLEVSICPRCLREMRARFTRPTAATYAEGVECDRCSDKILEIEGTGPAESSVA